MPKEQVMCIVCVELIKLKMTFFEAEKNLSELVNDVRTNEIDLKHQGRLKHAIETMDFDSLDRELEEGIKEIPLEPKTVKLRSSVTKKYSNFLLMLIALAYSVSAFAKLSIGDQVKITGGEYKDCTASVAVEENLDSPDLGLRNIRCVYKEGITTTVLTITYVSKIYVEKVK
jgi:hypothetical protein